MENEYRIVLNSDFTQKTLISYGLIVFAQDTKRFLLTRRKHSVEYILIIKNRYRIPLLNSMLKNLTQEEITHLKRCIEDLDYYKYIYYYLQGMDEFYFENKIIFKNNRLIIKNLLENSIKNKELNWTWPKGRQNFSSNEKPFECATREFKEEVEVDLPESIFISDKYFYENLTTYNSGWNIENRYWLYIIEKEFKLEQPLENIEVSERKWCQIDDCVINLKNKEYFKEVLEYMESFNWVFKS